MNTAELAPRFKENPEYDFDFGMEDFDLNAAFQDAITEVATDKELALDQKIQHMEVIVSEGTSEIYRDFVDFRAMAEQMEMMCNHDHSLHEALQENDTLSSFMDNHGSENSHDHADHKEKDSKKDKKKKKKSYSFFSFLRSED